MDPSYFYFSVYLSPSSFCEDPRSLCHGLGGDLVTHRGEEEKVQGTENRVEVCWSNNGIYSYQEMETKWRQNSPKR